ncbi:MAG: tetratricopeptide repeat protein [Deltaproteobacteria bacterium]|nr:tetratricopeptide repeat protein [Deltaproteobacteria bacterium]
MLIPLPWITGLSGYPAVFWDDGYAIPRSLGAIPRAFTRPWGSETDCEDCRRRAERYWRPLATVSLAVDHAVYGEWAPGYRLSSLVIHTASGVLLLLLFLRIGVSLPLASGATLFFAWHPIHSETLASAAYRTTLLEGLFALAATRVLLGRPPEGSDGPSGPRPGALRPGEIAWGLLLFLGALLSKDSAITLSAAIPLMVIGVRRLAWRQALLLSGVFLILGAGFWGLRSLVVLPVRDAVLGYLTLPERLLLMLKVPPLYAQLLAWPAVLNPHWDISLFFPPPVDLRTFAGLGILAADVALLAIGAVRRTVWVLPLAACNAVAVTFSGLVPLQVIAAERFLYLVFALGLLTAAIAWTVRHRRPGTGAGRGWLARAAMACALAMLLALAGRSAVRMRDWRTYHALAAARVRDFPGSFDARFSMAKTLAGEGRIEEAKAELRAAMAIYPDFPLATDLLRRLEARTGPGTPD